MKSFYRNDYKLFLILIPLINGFNYWITYTHFSFNAYFLLTFTIDTLQGYGAWLAIRWVIFKMEVWQPLIKITFKRLFLQLFLTSMVGLLVIITLTEAINAMARDTPAPANFYQLDIFIYLIWIQVINGIYIAFYYYKHWKLTENTVSESASFENYKFEIRTGKKNLKIPLAQILGFFAENKYTYLIDHLFKTYLVDYTLNELEAQLPASMFFRINRKFILNRESITAYKRIENNKISVSTKLVAPQPTEYIISRLKAPAFKKWFSQDAII